jgi:hypothetical protein
VVWRKNETVDPRDGRHDWATEFGQMETGLRQLGDLNGDHTIDAADYVAWRKGMSASAPVTYETWHANFGYPAQGVGQDFNADGTIDAADYVVWRKNWDATVGQGVYRTWRNHFGPDVAINFSAASSVGGAPIPEPTAPLLATTLSALLLTRRMNRPRRPPHV